MDIEISSEFGDGRAESDCVRAGFRNTWHVAHSREMRLASGGGFAVKRMAYIRLYGGGPGVTRVGKCRIT